jgi:hypothetical protein
MGEDVTRGQHAMATSDADGTLAGPALIWWSYSADPVARRTLETDA